MLRNKQSKSIVLSISLLLGMVIAPPLYAEENPSDTCISAAKLFKEGDVEGALEEARWCVTQLEQLKQNKTSSFFKDEIAGYTGGKLNAQQTMGMSILERKYSKDGQHVSVTMSGGMAGNAMSSIFGTIASMGMQTNTGKKVRIQRRSAIVSDENGNAQVVVTLKSGGVLTFDSSDISSDNLAAFAEEFPVAELDDSRK